MITKSRVAAAALALLIVPLSGCAPEPNSTTPDGKPLTEKQQPEGGSWQAENPAEATAKNTELPADFPAAFVVPENATVDDAGSRGQGTWFVVFRAENAEAANALWDAVIAGSGLTASAEEESGDGRSATLSSAQITASAMTAPGENGSVLVSYDITDLSA